MAILTVSRELGSGGREVGQAVAELLGYEYINKEKIFADIQADGKKWEDWAKDLDEHCPTIWERYDRSFKGFSALVQSHILAHALKDRVVIMGRGGNFLLKDIPYALRVRVIAPLDKRVERIMLRDSVDRETALWLAGKTDSERACFINIIYGRHWDNQKEYDMLLDTGARPLNEITETVKNALLEKERMNTEEARKILRMRATAAKVKAGILTNPRFFIPTLDVYFEDETLVIRGVVHSPKEHKGVEEEAKRLAAGVHVKCKLHYRV